MTPERPRDLQVSSEPFVFVDALITAFFALSVTDDSLDFHTRRP